MAYREFIHADVGRSGGAARTSDLLGADTTAKTLVGDVPNQR